MFLKIQRNYYFHFITEPVKNGDVKCPSLHQFSAAVPEIKSNFSSQICDFTY